MTVDEVRADDDREPLDRAAGEELPEPDSCIEIEEIWDPLGTEDAFEPGGGWGGSQSIAERLARIGIRQGLRVTSTKRSAPNCPGSDHCFNQKLSYALDISNGHSPTPQMDRAAKLMAEAMGRPGYSGGYILNVTKRGYRAQLIWRWTGHFNHVHIGIRKGG